MQLAVSGGDGLHSGTVEAGLEGVMLGLSAIRDELKGVDLSLVQLASRVSEALVKSDIRGVKVIQVWPNGETGKPAVGLWGECDRGAADTLHGLMKDFLPELQSVTLLYTTEPGHRDGPIFVRPWAQYVGPK